jgi:glucan endo-1,3-alpha-glucosidase
MNPTNSILRRGPSLKALSVHLLFRHVKNAHISCLLLFLALGFADGQSPAPVPPTPFYHLTFAGGSATFLQNGATNYGSLAGSATDTTPPDSTAEVQVAEDATLGLGGYAATFPMASDGLGPTLILPASMDNLQLLGDDDALTITAWIKWTGPNTNRDGRQVIASNMPGALNQGWAFSVQKSGCLQFNYCTPGGGNTRFSSTSIQRGVWTHVAMTWENNSTSGLFFYINGVSAGINMAYTGGGPLTNSGESIALGAMPGNALPLNGSLADIRLYNTALAPTDLTYVYSIKATGERYVFAHYLVALPTAGSRATVANFENEIQQAQARGIDGFALNCGAWNSSYQNTVAMIYQAAQELGTNFKLFISADMSSNLQNTDIANMIATCNSFPYNENQLYYNNKLVLSTYVGGPAQSSYIQDNYASSVFFVPSYHAHDSNGNAVETPTQEEDEAVLQDNQSLDGFFYFGAAGTPNALSTCLQEMAPIWHGADKLFMASITPYYRALAGNYRCFETNGCEGVIDEWQAAVAWPPAQSPAPVLQAADWAEIVTWNDYTESTYVAPFAETGATQGPWSAENSGSYLCHTGYLDLSQYYIQWFKLGHPPLITQDVIYYSYRLQNKTIQGFSNPTATPIVLASPVGATNLDDQIYVTVALTAPANLQVSVGTNSPVTYPAPAGISSYRYPFGNGIPQFTLLRNGNTILTQTGEQAISDNNNWANYQYFSSSSNSSSDPVQPPATPPVYQFLFQNKQLANTGVINNGTQNTTGTTSAFGSYALQAGSDPSFPLANKFSANFPMSSDGQNGPLMNTNGTSGSWTFPLNGQSDSFTVSTWIKWAGPNGSSDGRSIIASNMPSSLNKGWMFSVNNAGDLQFNYYTTTEGNTRISSSPIQKNQWTHVAMTWENNNKYGLTFYINGVPVSSSEGYTGYGPLTSSGLGVSLGALQQTFSLPINASLAHINFYPTALDPATVSVDSSQ